MSQPYLHEVMVEILRRHPGQWVNRDEVARIITDEDLWRRPRGVGYPDSDQIRLRARQRGDLFEGSDSRYTKVRLRRD